MLTKQKVLPVDLQVRLDWMEEPLWMTAGELSTVKGAVEELLG